MNKKLIVAWIVVLLLVISFGIWWRVYRLVEKPAPSPATVENTAAAPAPQNYVAPILYPEIPKLAGKVLTADGVKTKFYLGRNSQRYVFPDETKTFETWYPNGTDVVKVSRDELESYKLGGNVWYRPGTRLIKISTDTRVFAVLHGGVLRPIDLGAAGKIFGTEWEKLVDVLPDYYFTNYTIDQTPIVSESDYSRANELGKSPTIDADKGI